MLTSEWAFLIYLGLLLQVSGFLIREELLLRVLVATGITCDLMFFALQEPPIVPSVISNGILVLVNVVILGVILRERTTISMSPRERALFHALGTMTPGQFRRLMRVGQLHEADARTELAQQGQSLPHMCFVEGDTFYLSKGDRLARAKGPAFVGEIAFLRGSPASASVHVDAGTPYVTWQIDRLQPLLEKYPALRNALMTAVARDLADKVANSLPVGPETVERRHAAAPAVSEHG